MVWFKVGDEVVIFFFFEMKVGPMLTPQASILVQLTSEYDRHIYISRSSSSIFNLVAPTIVKRRLKEELNTFLSEGLDSTWIEMLRGSERL